jgi:hypothetical protein
VSGIAWTAGIPQHEVDILPPAAISRVSEASNGPPAWLNRT